VEEYLIFIAIGFIAQLIDGALGMAYGLTTITFLLNFGLPPVSASAVSHASECITTTFSAIAHQRFGNINPKFFFGLLLPGIFGALIGIFILTHVAGKEIRPYIAIYLLIMGLMILSKAFMVFRPQTVISHLSPLRPFMIRT